MTIDAIVFDAYGTLYDVQSVERVIEAAFPGHGALITPLWRQKQLEYSWLRSMMGRYEDFWQITQDSLAYTLDCLGLAADPALFARIAEAYNTLDPYPEAVAALQALAAFKLSIFSNGSPAMLASLVQNSGLAGLIDDIVSVDATRSFKPDTRTYAALQARLGVPPERVLFVSSNGFDVSGAKSAGFHVARIERVTPGSLRAELTSGAPIGPVAMFKALRTQPERLGAPPDFTLHSLAEVPALAANGFTQPSR